MLRNKLSKLFMRPRASEELEEWEEREERQVWDSRSFCIEDAEHGRLRIRSFAVDFDAQGNYVTSLRPNLFLPSPLEHIRRFPLNLKPDPKQWRLNPEIQMWKYPDFDHCLLQCAFARAEAAERYILWAFTTAPRKGTVDDCRSLRSMSEWRGSGGFPEYIFEKHLLECVFHSLDPEWRPSRGFVHTAEENPRPHIMFTMVHGTKGNEKLLRGEVFAILATIKTRLTIPWLKDHFIIPVLVFSFMGPQHGRILQAYFDGSELVIYKSKLYDFKNEETAPVELFLQYLMNTPSGDTTSLPTPSLKVPQ